jgi:membrane protein DedA with SNARE-associated domain
MPDRPHDHFITLLMKPSKCFSPEWPAALLTNRRREALIIWNPVTLETIIQTYGYFAVFLGTFIEGETFLVLGMSRVGRRRFAFLNAAGAIAWSILGGLGGYLFGHALEAIIGHVERYELRIMGGIAAAGALLWLLSYLRKRT